MLAAGNGSVGAARRSDWRRAGFRELGRIALQLRGDEWKYVPLTSRLRTERWTHHSPTRPWQVLVGASSSPPSAVLITDSGLVLPALQPATPLPRHFASLLGSSRAAVYSVMGTRADVQAVEQVMPRPPGTAVDYLLMTVDEASFQSPPPSAYPLLIKRGSGADTDLLFELQRGYEIEEVLLHPARFNPESCRRQLRQALRRGVVLYATYQGRPVAKAATNARGFAVDQIGGVYTAPQLRGHAVAAAVMTALLRQIFTGQRSATLFVKPNNGAAIALYQKVGFRLRDHYRIAYYFD